jgi:Fanconi anemia group M protein
MTFLNPFSKKTKKEKREKIIIDHREKNSLVVSELVGLGFSIEYKQLPVADYIIGDVAIERKTLSDFKSSIINKRIMRQLLELKQYPQPILILEGLEEEDPYSGLIHENAFRGFLLSILNEYKIPIIFTLNAKDTALYISVLAKKKQKSSEAIRATKITLTPEEQIQFVLEGFPYIGPKTAEKLIKHFKSLNNIFNASEEELKGVIGKKSELIFKLINLKF